MKPQKKSQLKNKANKISKKEATKFRKQVHAAVNGTGKMPEFPGNWGTGHEEPTEGEETRFIEGQSLFTDELNINGIEDVEEYSHANIENVGGFSPKEISAFNIVRAGNVLVTLDTMEQALDVSLKNLLMIYGKGTKYSAIEKKSKSITKMVGDIRKSVTPELKKYVAVQAKAFKTDETTPVEYVENIETLKTICKH